MYLEILLSKNSANFSKRVLIYNFKKNKVDMQEKNIKLIICKIPIPFSGIWHSIM